MVGEKRFRFFGAFFLLAIVLIVGFVWANTAANISFNSASGTSADNNGFFTINWTNTTTASAIGNWTVTIWTNNTFTNITDAANTTGNATHAGYTWADVTQGNYTFSFSAFLVNNTHMANSTNVSMYVDSTVPVVDWADSGYTNATAKKNTALLTLNISVADTLSGFTDGYCVFDINETNETVAVSGDWCNTTQLNLTGLADGNHTIDIWVNDSANNVGVNLSTYVVWVDTTAPVATFTCSPSVVTQGGLVTCTCSGSDAGSSINSSATVGTTTITTSATGAQVATGCSVTDYAGNSHTADGSYIVTDGGGGPASSSTALKWTKTYSISDNQFKEGYTQQLATKGRIKFKVGSTIHQVGVLELTETTAKIEVSSTPQEATLAIGDTRKFDVSEEGYYDISVTLNSILDGKADLTIMSINELITEESEVGEQEKEEDAEGGEEIQESSSIFKKWWFWLIVVLVIVGIGYYVKENNSK